MRSSVGGTGRFFGEKINGKRHRDAMVEWKSKASHDLLFNIGRCVPVSFIRILVKYGAMMFASMPTTVQQYGYQRLQLGVCVTGVMNMRRGLEQLVSM
jgi:hypothetical protein